MFGLVAKVLWTTQRWPHDKIDVIHTVPTWLGRKLGIAPIWAIQKDVDSHDWSIDGVKMGLDLVPLTPGVTLTVDSPYLSLSYTLRDDRVYGVATLTAFGAINSQERVFDPADPV